jgi:Putative Flp pilus-assembly TadE/G-like
MVHRFFFAERAKAMPENSPMRRSKQAGQALVLAALGLTVFLLAAGLGIDMGFLRYQKRLQQSAADSAAIAGAAQYGYNATPGSCLGVATAAKTDSASNGFTDGADQVTVTPSCPPADGPHAGAAGYVEVLVTKIQPTFFVKIAGVNSATVTARAVAFLGNGPACVYTLDPSAANAFTSTSGSVVTLGCGVIDDSNSSNAWNVTNYFPPFLGVVGGPADPSDHVQTHIVPAADPLANVQPPSAGACTPTTTRVNFTGQPVVTISPGTYCSGLTISGNTSVTFAAGTYVILGGGLTITGNTSVNASNVTFYITYDGSHPYGPVTLSGNGNANFSAPTSGSLAGMLFFQDRTVAISTSPGEASTVSGGASNTFEGAIYFPTTALSFFGNSSPTGSTVLVGDTVTISGATNLDGSVPPGQSQIKAAVLVE